MDTTAERKPRRRLLLAGVATALAVLSLAAWLVWLAPRRTTFVMGGQSMEPTLGVGERFVVDLRDRDPERGSIIVFLDPGQVTDGPAECPDSQCIAKRVIALPGETIEMRDGDVLIDGRQLDEPYVARVEPMDFGPQELGENRYFVMGDNRPSSLDSRIFGAIDEDTIVGTVIEGSG